MKKPKIEQEIVKSVKNLSPEDKVLVQGFVMGLEIKEQKNKEKQK